MRMYRGHDGTWFRTQGEAKGSEQPFEPVEVPTDHKGLTDFLNTLNVPEREPEPVSPLQIAPDDPDREYQNGDPTSLFMKSRDPKAIFMCVHCGRQNHNTTETV